MELEYIRKVVVTYIDGSKETLSGDKLADWILRTFIDNAEIRRSKKK